MGDKRTLKIKLHEWHSIGTESDYSFLKIKSISKTIFLIIGYIFSTRYISSSTFSFKLSTSRTMRLVYIIKYI